MSDPRKYADTVNRVVPLLMVTDMERSLRYYQDGLGFTMGNTWVVDGKLRWCWLELGTAALMLQEWNPGRHPDAGAKTGFGVSLWFNCTDSIAIYRDVIARGIEAIEPQVGNFAWEFFMSDPDGYRINFTSPTDYPDETKLSETDL